MGNTRTYKHKHLGNFGPSTVISVKAEILIGGKKVGEECFTLVAKPK
jgi:hypothetical protein